MTRACSSRTASRCGCSRSRGARMHCPRMRFPNAPIRSCVSVQRDGDRGHTAAAGALPGDMEEGARARADVCVCRCARVGDGACVALRVGGGGGAGLVRRPPPLRPHRLTRARRAPWRACGACRTRLRAACPPRATRARSRRGRTWPVGTRSCRCGDVHSRMRPFACANAAAHMALCIPGCTPHATHGHVEYARACGCEFPDAAIYVSEYAFPYAAIYISECPRRRRRRHCASRTCRCVRPHGDMDSHIRGMGWWRWRWWWRWWWWWWWCVCVGWG